MAGRGEEHFEDLSTPSDLLLRLCCLITELEGEAVLPQFQYALSFLASGPVKEFDEFHTVEQIKTELAIRNKARDAAEFHDIHRRLQSQTLLKNRGAILKLLNSLSFSGEEESQTKLTGAGLFSQGLPFHQVSTPYNAVERSHYKVRSGGSTSSQGQSLSLALSAGSQYTGGSSGISSIHGRDSERHGPSPVHQSFIPSHLQTPALGASNSYGVSSLAHRVRTVAILGSKHEVKEKKYLQPARNLPGSKIDDSEEIAEQMILRDLVYALQGIDGKWLKYEAARDAYKTDSQVSIWKPMRQEAMKISECGWLFSKIKAFVHKHKTDKAFGLVGQSFCTSLQDQITEYLRLLAVLDAQLHQDLDPGLGESCYNLTMAQLQVWTRDPRNRLKWLASLVDVSKGKKGGALASTIYSYTWNGSEVIRSLVTNVLTFVCQPIYATLLRWIYDGELEDTYHEFFVASDPMVRNEQLWYDKYSLRKSMIPSFISTEQASKILLTGKSINFLRQVCEDRTPIKGREAAMKMDLSHASILFTQDENSNFQQMLDRVYKMNSGHLLDVLQNKYKFLEHLKAMRRYLLLGQGDFIRHLMDLLEEDLAKPASNLFLHNLTGILESAIRATNAQYDDLDILKRLDVRLLDVSPGDTGWDVFSLEYSVDGPIRTVFTRECKIMYLRVFNFMWRAKRMEYVLAMIWKNQTSGARELKRIPELGPVMHQCHLICSCMVHFIKQVQYYINFEVLECAWDELLTKVYNAEDLDYIIAAHQVFLDTILSRCLLSDKSTEILQLLRTIFDLIIQFQGAQGTFYENAILEVQTRDAFDRNCKERAQRGAWEITEEIEKEEKTRRAKTLSQLIRSTQNQLEVLFRAYKETVESFLTMVASHQDVSLRFLSFRLDFNQHYNVKEPKGRPSLLRI